MGGGREQHMELWWVSGCLAYIIWEEHNMDRLPARLRRRKETREYNLSWAGAWGGEELYDDSTLYRPNGGGHSGRLGL